MDALVELVSEKAGISSEQARKAVDVVLGHLRENLPSPLAAQLDNVVSGGMGLENAGNVAKGLGGIFGKK